MTLDGKLKSPEFIFRFSRVSAYYSVPATAQTPREANPTQAEESKPRLILLIPRRQYLLSESTPDTPVAQQLPAGTTPEGASNPVGSEGRAEISRALENWAKANESNV